jgi:hypothetical protein
VNEAGDSAVNLSAMSVVAALAVDGVVTLSVASNEQTAPRTNAVVAALVAVDVSANNVALPGMKVATRQETGGCGTGGE